MKRFTNDIVDIQRGDADIDKVYRGVNLVWERGSAGIGVFFATVADTVITNGTSNRIMTSPDGINWTLRNVPAFANYLAGGCVGDLGYTTNKPGKTGLLVASAGEASGSYWSENGIDFNFVSHNTPTPSNYQTGHASIYSDTLDLFVEVVHSEASILSSTTGKGFTKSAQPVRCLWNPYSGIYSNAHNLFIQGGDVFSVWNTALMTSPDGFTWTRRILSGKVKGIAYSPQLNLYLTGSDGNTRFRSTDGISWLIENRTPTFSSGIIWVEQSTPYFLTWFINSSNVNISYNGTSWQSVSFPINTTRCITYSKTLDLLVATGTGQICTSTNGINWTLRTSPTNLQIPSVSFGL